MFCGKSSEAFDNLSVGEMRMEEAERLYFVEELRTTADTAV